MFVLLVKVVNFVQIGLFLLFVFFLEHFESFWLGLYLSFENKFFAFCLGNLGPLLSVFESKLVHLCHEVATKIWLDTCIIVLRNIVEWLIALNKAWVLAKIRVTAFYPIDIEMRNLVHLLLCWENFFVWKLWLFCWILLTFLLFLQYVKDFVDLVLHLFLHFWIWLRSLLWLVDLHLDVLFLNILIFSLWPYPWLPQILLWLFKQRLYHIVREYITLVRIFQICNFPLFQIVFLLLNLLSILMLVDLLDSFDLWL